MILHSEPFQGPQGLFALQFLWKISMLVWCFKEISNQYISSSQSQALGLNMAPRELISGPPTITQACFEDPDASSLSGLQMSNSRQGSKPMQFSMKLSTLHARAFLNYLNRISFRTIPVLGNSMPTLPINDGEFAYLLKIAKENFPFHQKLRVSMKRFGKISLQLQ